MYIMYVCIHYACTYVYMCVYMETCKNTCKLGVGAQEKVSRVEAVVSSGPFLGRTEQQA